MKVFELMSKLSTCNAGAEVKIHMLKSLDEIPEQDEELREIDFSVKSVDDNDDVVYLDGWTE